MNFKMTNEPTTNLNRFHLMMKIDEVTDEAFFLCPFSGQNVVLWEDDFEDHDVDIDLLDAYLAKLPPDRQFSCLIVGHPDQVHGDFVVYLYEGVVSEEFVAAWS